MAELPWQQRMHASSLFMYTVRSRVERRARWGGSGPWRVARRRACQCLCRHTAAACQRLQLLQPCRARVHQLSQIFVAAHLLHHQLLLFHLLQAGRQGRQGRRSSDDGQGAASVQQRCTTGSLQQRKPGCPAPTCCMAWAAGLGPGAASGAAAAAATTAAAAAAAAACAAKGDMGGGLENWLLTPCSTVASGPQGAASSTTSAAASPGAGAGRCGGKQTNSKASEGAMTSTAPVLPAG